MALAAFCKQGSELSTGKVPCWIFVASVARYVARMRVSEPQDWSRRRSRDK